MTQQQLIEAAAGLANFWLAKHAGPHPGSTVRREDYPDEFSYRTRLAIDWGNFLVDEAAAGRKVGPEFFEESDGQKWADQSSQKT